MNNHIQHPASQILKRKRFDALDSFRGIFAICVVVFHMHYVNSVTEFPFFKGSYLFVEFFFVLSGFVLAHGYAFRKDLSFKQFSISRIFRLLPLHIVMLFVFIMLEFLKLVGGKHGFAFNNPAFTGANAVKEILPNLFLLQSWTNYTHHSSFNSPSWSISVELYMYFVFFASIRIRGLFRYFIWGLILLGMFVLQTNESSFLDSRAITGLSCFFAGTFTYLLYRNTHESIRTSRLGFTVLEFVSFVLIYFAITNNMKHREFVPRLIFCFSIFIFSFEAGELSRFFRHKIFGTIGKLSYSIYMVHSSVLFCSLIFFFGLQKVFNLGIVTMHNGERAIDLGSTLANNMAVGVTIIIVISLSTLTYRFIEKSGSRFGKKIIECPRQKNSLL